MKKLNGTVSIELESYNELMAKLNRFESAMKVQKRWGDDIELVVNAEMLREIIIEKFNALNLDGYVLRSKEFYFATTTVADKVSKEETEIEDKVLDEVEKIAPEVKEEAAEVVPFDEPIPDDYKIIRFENKLYAVVEEKDGCYMGRRVKKKDFNLDGRYSHMYPTPIKV